MGIMPFHLEKGVMGLRFDYLTRSPDARPYLAAQLVGGPVDPFVVAANINIGGIHIDVLNDDMTTFMNALDQLCALNNYRFDAHERRTGQEYQEDNNALEPRNQDTLGTERPLSAIGHGRLHLAEALRSRMICVGRCRRL